MTFSIIFSKKFRHIFIIVEEPTFIIPPFIMTKVSLERPINIGGFGYPTDLC